MKLEDIINRNIKLESFLETESIPWDRKDFSERMLKEHLSQSHDMCSRREIIIKNQVEWIHKSILNEKHSKILELGCGPGFYTNSLSELGHKCKGIDFAPASIEYANKRAVELNLDCEYVLNDLRTVEYGDDIDLILMLFGDFQSQNKEDALKILCKVFHALNSKGLLLLELIPYEKLIEIGKSKATWSTKNEGIFSDEPHILLNDYIWDEQNEITTRRYYIIDAATSQVEKYSNHLQAYTSKEIDNLLKKGGFTIIKSFDTIGNLKDDTGLNLYCVLAEKDAN